MLNQEQFNGKWKEIKGGVRNLWGDITDDELEKTRGNWGAISGLVESKYGETKESIKEKIDSLMGSFENETDKTNFSETSYERKPTAVRTSSRSQTQDAAQDPQTRSTERAAFEKKVSENKDLSLQDTRTHGSSINVADDEEDDFSDFDAETEESHVNYEAKGPVSSPKQDFDNDRNARH